MLKALSLKAHHYRLILLIFIFKEGFSFIARDITEDKRAEAMIKASLMAFLHEQSYQSKIRAGINFASYAQSFVKDLAASYENALFNITTKTRINGVFLNIDTTVLRRPIINGLISSFSKYAFKPFIAACNWA